MLLDAVQIQEILPHRYPFLFIDGILSFDEDTPSLVAVKLVSAADPILQGHFPGNPIMPGVVQVEAMAQAAVVLGKLAGTFDAEKHHCYFLKIEEARFKAPVVPGDRVEIFVKALRMGKVGKFYGEVRGDDKVRSTATITAAFYPKDKAR